MWKELIDSLGGTGAVSDHLGVASNAVSNWTKRGVPWRFRPAVAQLAKQKRQPLPDGFLDPASAQERAA